MEIFQPEWKDCGIENEYTHTISTINAIQMYGMQWELPNQIF